MLLVINGEARELDEGAFFYVPAFRSHSVSVMKMREVSYTVISFRDVHELNRLKEHPEIWREIENRRLSSLFNYACSVSLSEEKKLKDSISLVVRYIQVNYMNLISIKDLSQAAGISLSRLQHVFKEATGLPLKQFILQEKIRKARGMLTDKTLIDIALDCGFYDQSHFIRHFKKQTGITPQRYSSSIKSLS